MVARHGGARLSGHDVLAFRRDLAYEATSDGFRLHARGTELRFRDPEIGARLGALIAEGTRTAGEIHVELISAGADIFRIAEILNDFYGKGLLDDDPASGRIGGAGRSDEDAPAACTPAVA
jgi:hypothetical protein